MTLNERLAEIGLIHDKDVKSRDSLIMYESLNFSFAICDYWNNSLELQLEFDKVAVLAEANKTKQAFSFIESILQFFKWVGMVFTVLFNILVIFVKLVVSVLLTLFQAIWVILKVAAACLVFLISHPVIAVTAIVAGTFIAYKKGWIERLLFDSESFSLEPILPSFKFSPKVIDTQSKIDYEGSEGTYSINDVLTAGRNAGGEDATEEHLQNIQELIVNILNPLAYRYGKRVPISSGFRSPKKNQAVGGKKTSQHLKGEAADLDTGTIEGNREVFEILYNMGNYDQLIWENGGEWVHVSYSSERQRHMIVGKNPLLNTPKSQSKTTVNEYFVTPIPY